MSAGDGAAGGTGGDGVKDGEYITYTHLRFLNGFWNTLSGQMAGSRAAGAGWGSLTSLGIFIF